MIPYYIGVNFVFIDFDTSGQERIHSILRIILNSIAFTRIGFIQLSERAEKTHMNDQLRNSNQGEKRMNVHSAVSGSFPRITEPVSPFTII